MNSRENSSVKCVLSVCLSYFSLAFARRKSQRAVLHLCYAFVTPSLHPLHPPKQGVSPVFIGVVTPLHPIFQIFSQQIEYVEYMQPELVPENPLKKGVIQRLPSVFGGYHSIVDVRCRDNRGRQFICIFTSNLRQFLIISF